MIEKKFNWKIYFFIILFLVILLTASKVIYMLLTGQVADENGEQFPGVFVGVIIFMFFWFAAHMP